LQFINDEVKDGDKEKHREHEEHAEHKKQNSLEGHGKKREG
jgi:hypothetical protein